MKITSIPQVYRNLNRTLQIVSVFSKYGLADWISRLDVDFAKDFLKGRDGEALARFSHNQRIRLALVEAGPSFVKLGQMLSTRPDLVGPALARELEQLQASLPADPPQQVRTLIEKELKRPLSELFAQFDEQPLASASIGQVHGAVLPNGERVVVKVQHPSVEATMKVDLDILAGIAQFAERLPEFKNYRPTATIEEFRRTLLRELDFTREMRNMERFCRIFEGDAEVVIPRPLPQLCTSRILTMQRIDGLKLAETDKLAAANVDLEVVARRGSRVFLDMIFMHGFYHADPHPGNVLVLPGNIVGLLDFGMVGHVDEELRDDIEEMLLALAAHDAPHLTSLVTRIGAGPPDLDRSSLSLDINDFVSHYANLPLAEFDLGGALTELTQIINRYQIMLPARIAMLLKVLVELEGTGRQINPRFSLNEVLQPYQRQLRWRRLSPGRQLRKLWRIYGELEHLAEALPRGILDILQQVQTGKFDVHLDHRGLEPSVNRLVLGLLTSALFVGSSMMLSWKVWPLVREVSVAGAVGVAMSLAMGLRLLWAIRRSGHLDRK